MSWYDWLLIMAVVYCVVAPPKYDLAMRLKKWTERER